MARFAKSYSVFHGEPIVYVPVESVQMMHGEFSASFSAHLASVVIALHYGFYEYSILRKKVSVRLPNFVGNSFVEMDSVV